MRSLMVLLLACAPAASPQIPTQVARKEPTTQAHHVVVISLDGLMPDSYLHPEAHGLSIPTLRSMASRGATSDGVLAAFPSVTYPAHTSMVTGVFPGRHGIVSNRTFDPLEGDLDGWRWYAEDVARDPIWRLVEREGYTSAIVWWPVTTGAQVTWRVPEYWRAKNDNDRKVLRALSTPGLLDAVAKEHADFWPRFAPPNVTDDALTDIALHILEQKPTLLLLHLVEVDGAQHDHGVWSKEARAAMEKDDTQVARILSAIDKLGMTKDTNVVVVSDHGFLDAPKMVNPCALLRDAGLVTVNQKGKVTAWKAAILNSSGQAYVYVKDESDTVSVDAARKLFLAKTKEDGSGIGKIFDPAEIKELGGDPRAAFAIEPTIGFQFGGSCNAPFVATAPAYMGTHGYDPRRPELKASLLMVGPTIPHGTITGARLVDIGPTVASWLGLTMPDVDGKALVVSPTH